MIVTVLPSLIVLAAALSGDAPSDPAPPGAGLHTSLDFGPIQPIPA